MTFNPEAMTRLRKDLKDADGNPLSVSKLARMVGTDRTLVSGWENGRRTPTVASMTNLADALGCSLDDLVIRRNPPAAPAPTE